MSKQDRQGTRSPALLDKWRGQDEVFNRLTVNGTKKAIARDAEGNLYINADYIKTGKLAADLIDVVNLIARQLHAENENGDYVQIQNGEIIAKNADDAETEFFALRRDKNDSGVFSLVFHNTTKDGERVKGSLSHNSLSLGAADQADAAFSVTASASTGPENSTVRVRLPDKNGRHAGQEKDLYTYWKQNNDGSYSIVGYENELQ